MALEDYNGGTWTCEKCGESVSFAGPATKALAISNHMYYTHERPARQKELWAAPPSVPLVDDSFYAGRQLTKYDDSLLANLHIRWDDKPVDNQQHSA